jgi:hypothetical protein
MAILEGPATVGALIAFDGEQPFTSNTIDSTSPSMDMNGIKVPSTNGHVEEPIIAKAVHSIPLPPATNSVKDVLTNGHIGQDVPVVDGHETSVQDDAYQIPLNDQLAFTPRRLRVITIGAGFSGLMMAHKFQHRFPEMDKIIEHTIYEKRHEVGGTVSQLYQLSLAGMEPEVRDWGTVADRLSVAREHVSRRSVRCPFTHIREFQEIILLLF